MTSPKLDVSDPEWTYWFRQKMDKASLREEAFWERMRRVAKLQDENLNSVPMVDQNEA